jgi:hypothetical protein
LVTGTRGHLGGAGFVGGWPARAVHETVSFRDPVVDPDARVVEGVAQRPLDVADGDRPCQSQDQRRHGRVGQAPAHCCGNEGDRQQRDCAAERCGDPLVGGGCWVIPEPEQDGQMDGDHDGDQPGADNDRDQIGAQQRRLPPQARDDGEQEQWGDGELGNVA